MKVNFDKCTARFRKSARALLENKEKLKKLTTKAMETIGEKAAFQEIREEVFLSLSLLRDWAKGDYTGVSKGSLLLITACVLYLLNPLDIVPDFILGLGFLDDVSVFMALTGRIGHELRAYRKFLGV